MSKSFWNLYPLYMTSPPVQVDPCDGILKRHGGGSSRCGFWAGYDGITQGGRIGSPGSVVRTAHRAGVAYRKLVDTGKADPLPEMGGKS